jgi:hypothetical protein
MSLITVDEIEMLLGVTFSAEEESVIELYINFAVGEIEAWLGRPVSVQSFQEDVIADADGRVYLSNTPVVAVTSITVDGEVKEDDFYLVTPWGLENIYYRTRGGVVDYWELGDPQKVVDEFYEPEIIVEYTAGLDTPDGVNSVIAAGVIRKWNERKTQLAKDDNDANAINQIRIEDYFIKYEDATTFQTSSYIAGSNPITIFRNDADFNSIKRFKRRSIA